MSRKKTPEEYYNECKENGLDLPIEDYVNNKTKIRFKCSRGHIYFQRPDHHLNNHGCKLCATIKLSNKRRKTTKQYIQECKETGQDLPIEDYKNNKTRIKHKCSKGHIYSQTPDMHIGKYKQGCPKCNESHGEKYIRNYLDKNHIEYIPQKRFHDLKDKTYLSYDFYIPKKKVLIEYQGQQHYISKDYFGGNKQLEKQQLHDKSKRDYALNNGYTLLEPTYKLDTQEKVNKYLDNHLIT